MRDFKQQLKAYGDELRNIRYPYSEVELDKEIRSVIWNISQNENTIPSTKRRLWPTVAAAAVVAALIIPTAIFTRKNDLTGELTSVKVDGQHIYFACNNGCTPEGTLQNFKAIIQ